MILVKKLLNHFISFYKKLSVLFSKFLRMKSPNMFGLILRQHEMELLPSKVGD